MNDENIVNEETMENIGKGLYIAASTKQLISAIVFIFIGICMVIVSSISSIYDMKYVETTATVVDVRYDRETKNYYPIYEYNYNGKTVRVESHFGSNEAIVIGSQQIINYDPNDYEHYNVGSRKTSMMLFVTGIILTVVAIFPIRNYVRLVKYIKEN